MLRSERMNGRLSPWRAVLMLVTLGGAAVAAPAEGLHLTVTNTEGFDRTGEILALRLSELAERSPAIGSSPLLVLKLPEKVELPVQRTETELLVQIDLGAHRSCELLIQPGVQAKPLSSRVDGRFVLPRQDYAWENDRIAYRVYGPALKGEVRNGIDVWTKRVPHLIVAKWYRESEGSPPGKDTYHVDRGEGADFFSVGKSLGAGAAGLWSGDRLHQPGVFSSWKTIENGPLRVQFELTYDSLRANGVLYSAICRVTLEAGSNLNRIDVTYRGARGPGQLVVACGLVKREGAIARAEESEGWLSLWGPTTADTANGYTGTGIVFPPSVSASVREDSLHHLLLGTMAPEAVFTYYAGAGWTRSGDFDTGEDWNEYLSRFSRSIRSPLRVAVTGEPD